MNQLLIAEAKPENIEPRTFYIQYSMANDMLPMFRSDYFLKLSIILSEGVQNSALKFLMHVNRVLAQSGQIEIKGVKQSVQKAATILRNMGLHIEENEKDNLVHFQKVPKGQVNNKKESKLAIGFQSYDGEEIDEEQLLKNQKISLPKQEGGSCADKPKACANCNCGRKSNEPQPSKEELVNSVNEGKPVSGCGKCFLGDSFRCGTCPYKGLPAFKPGDKLKLVDNSNVVVEESGIIKTAGKVKIEL